jgi:hypothetical protein
VETTDFKDVSISRQVDSRTIAVLRAMHKQKKRWAARLEIDDRSRLKEMGEKLLMALERHEAGGAWTDEEQREPDYDMPGWFDYRQTQQQHDRIRTRRSFRPGEPWLDQGDPYYQLERSERLIGMDDDERQPQLEDHVEQPLQLEDQTEEEE